MSNLRNRLDRERVEAAERAQKGQAPKVYMPEAPAQQHDYSRQDSQDAAVRPLARGSDPRSRLGQPVLLPAPDPDAVTVSLDRRMVQSQLSEQQRIAQLRRDQDAARERQRQADAERQRVAAAEAELLRIAGEQFERETQSLEIQEVTGSLTLAEYATVESLVRSRYPKSVNDPSAWRLAINEFREAGRDYPEARAKFNRIPVDSIMEMSNSDLSDFLGCPPSFVQKLKDTLL